MAIKTFTTGEVLTASDTNTYLANAGLVYVTSTSMSGTTNTFTNTFSSTYDAYRIVVTNFNNSSTTTRAFYLRLGTDATSTYLYGHQYIYGAGTNAVTGASGQTASILGNVSQYSGQGFVIDVYNPYLSIATNWAYQAVTHQSDVGALVYRQGYGSFYNTTSFTGFQFIGTSPDTLSGLVTVYGYRKA